MFCKYSPKRSFSMSFGKKMAVFAAVFTLASGLTFSQAADNEALYIVFPANSADLRGVRGETAIRNSQVFTQVAQLLMENPQYRILIDGHANPVIGTQQEESGSLRPLSVRRAETTADFLASYYGVNRRRLILTGAGGGYPSRERDPALNRRVNFVVVLP
jgi:outer membrane protein OmpA-like peptidoglycan-associated protein